MDGFSMSQLQYQLAYNPAKKGATTLPTQTINVRLQCKTLLHCARLYETSKEMPKGPKASKPKQPLNTKILTSSKESNKRHRA